MCHVPAERSKVRRNAAQYVGTGPARSNCVSKQQEDKIVAVHIDVRVVFVFSQHLSTFGQIAETADYTLLQLHKSFTLLTSALPIYPLFSVRQHLRLSLQRTKIHLSIGACLGILCDAFVFVFLFVLSMFSFTCS